MNLSFYFVMVIASAVLANCNDAATAKKLEKSNLFEVSKTNAGTDLHADGRTFVRLKVNDQEEEERAGVINAGKVDDIINDVTDDIPALVTKFKSWDGKTGEEILSSPSLVRLSSKKFMERLNLWGEYKALGEKMFVQKQKRMQAKRTGQ